MGQVWGWPYSCDMTWKYLCHTDTAMCMPNHQKTTMWYFVSDSTNAVDNRGQTCGHKILGGSFLEKIYLWTKNEV